MTAHSAPVRSRVNGRRKSVIGLSGLIANEFSPRAGVATGSTADWKLDGGGKDEAVHKKALFLYEGTQRRICFMIAGA